MKAISLVSSSPTKPTSHKQPTSPITYPSRLSLRKPSKPTSQEKHVPVVLILSSSDQEQEPELQENSSQHDATSQEESFQGLHSLDANRLLQYQNQFGDGSLKSTSASSSKNNYAFKNNKNTFKTKRKKRFASLKSKKTTSTSSSKRQPYNHYKNEDPGFKDSDVHMKWEGWSGIPL